MPLMSILDIVRYTDDKLVGQAINDVRDTAIHAEKWGYHRYWVAEHHNLPGIGSTATAVLVGYIAAGLLPFAEHRSEQTSAAQVVSLRRVKCRIEGTDIKAPDKTKRKSVVDNSCAEQPL